MPKNRPIAIHGWVEIDDKLVRVLGFIGEDFGWAGPIETQPETVSMKTQERKDAHRRGASFSQDEISIVLGDLEWAQERINTGQLHSSPELKLIRERVRRKFERMANSF